MPYKNGDLVLVKFPFTNLTQAKKRPVLVIKSQSALSDIVCLQVTSNADQAFLMSIQANDFIAAPLPLNSYVKYDKCFTLDVSLVEKKLTQLTPDCMNRLKALFCDQTF